jgi:hypothetical protein
MYLGRTLPLVVAISAVAVASISRSGEQLPQTAPTRDVDITYRMTQPGLPVTMQRRRWLAGRHLRRVDGPDKSATIFDQSSGELTRMSPEGGTILKRGGESEIAGQNCIDWRLAAGPFSVRYV